MALITNGQELALTYLDSDRNFPTIPGVYQLRRFTPGGTVISDWLFAAADPAQGFAFSEHDFVWTGSAYISTAVFASGRDLNSLLLKVCPLTVRIAIPRTILANDEFVTFTAVAAGGVPPYSYRWSTTDVSVPFAGPTLRYRFNIPGTYSVTVTVTDQAGVTSTDTITVRVVERKQRAVRRRP